MAELRFLGHACFELRSGGSRVLIDPFLTDNPHGVVAAEDVSPTHILLTHGHMDHYGNVEEIAERSGAEVVAIVDLAYELRERGVERVTDTNLGGTVEFDWGWARYVPAFHASLTPMGRVNVAAGIVIGIDGATVYHLGDTAVFAGLELIRRRNPIDVALVCIGGHYTMDRHDAVTACELLAPIAVVPCHYDTFTEIETDVEAFKRDAEARTGTTVHVMEPGAELSVRAAAEAAAPGRGRMRSSP
jgi:L-ascorbate metabolism protein UlaG (beta-lactamase superfamily)